MFQESESIDYCLSNACGVGIVKAGTVDSGTALLPFVRFLISRDGLCAV